MRRNRTIAKAREMIKYMLYIFLAVNIITIEFNAQSDSTSKILIGVDFKSTPVDRAVTTINDNGSYNSIPGTTIFEGYYKNDWLTDIGLELLYRHKKGIMLGYRMQFYPATIYGKKINNFLMLGYSLKLGKNFYLNCRFGATYWRLTYMENKNTGKIVEYNVYVDSTKQWINVRKEMIYDRLNDFYMDGQVCYSLKKNFSLYMIFSLMREYGYTKVNAPRTGIGTGKNYSYILYLKSIGIGLIYKFDL